MKVKVLRRFKDKYDNVTRYEVGSEHDFETERAQDLISRGLAEAVKEIPADDDTGGDTKSGDTDKGNDEAVNTSKEDNPTGDSAGGNPESGDTDKGDDETEGASKKTPAAGKKPKSKPKKK